MGWPFDDMIAKIFLPYFHKHGEGSFKFLVEGKVSSQAFLSVYHSLTPIEEMPSVEKIKLKQTVIKMFPEKTPEEMIKACKIIYSIGVVSQYVTE